MNVLDLFSGIGGFSLGLERAGMHTVAFCEIDPYCRAVLRKHWPNVPIFEDVRTLTAADVPGVDVICGGFPCQDISYAGKGGGLDGERSGLWIEYRRLICEIRPRFVIVENVAALLNRGLDRVTGDLAEIRYDAQWDCLRAARIGLPQSRDRVWIVAYPAGNDGPKRDLLFSGAFRGTQEQFRGFLRLGRGHREIGGWETSCQPRLVRNADGIPSVMDRNRALGNAVVPQIPEIIGRAIMSIAR